MRTDLKTEVRKGKDEFIEVWKPLEILPLCGEFFTTQDSHLLPTLLHYNFSLPQK